MRLACFVSLSLSTPTNWDLPALLVLGGMGTGCTRRTSEKHSGPPGNGTSNPAATRTTQQHTFLWVWRQGEKGLAQVFCGAGMYSSPGRGHGSEAAMAQRRQWLGTKQEGKLF
eukprot:1147590-Pelagomonas_calceolata.AAC.4